MSHILTLILTLLLLELVNSQCLSNQKCVAKNMCPMIHKASVLFSCQNGKRKGICCSNVDSPHVRHPKYFHSEEFDTISPRRNDLRLHKNFPLLPEKCGKSELVPGNRIEDGEATEHGEYPWMAYILVRRKSNVASHCSGAVINNRHILTAAHCTTGVQKASQMRVFSGIESLSCIANGNCSLDVQRRRVQRMIPHPNYLPTKGANNHQVNDIALLFLEKALEFNALVVPICLPVEESLRRSLYRRNLTLLGWGSNANESNVLQKISVKFIKSEECALLWNTPLLVILKSQVCILGDRKSRPTRGDSGGPLLTKDSQGKGFVVAITSFGHPTRRELPVILVRIGKYVEWILDNLQP